MKAFTCQKCGNRLYFENSACVSCGTRLAYSREEREIVPVSPEGSYVGSDGSVRWVCTNTLVTGCNWLARREGGVCFACELTGAHPDDTAPASVRQQYSYAEQAKRHLLVELDALGLVVRTKREDPAEGLIFDLLASDGIATTPDVVIGHNRGVITIDLAESDDAYREHVRATLAEPYRTMLGHFRHEVGHYFEWQLVRGSEVMERCTEVFGDESVPYEQALKRHYSEGPPKGWEHHYISTYATMHPFEDFAETWAHFLHIHDTLGSAASHGLAAPVPTDKAFSEVVTDVWVPLSAALNVINRSMGHDDLYPFVIPPAVLDKLDFVASLVQDSTTP
ncbi:hypothetical protein FB381_0577 [Nocardioides albertanoniae]|uniref:Zinc-ribbon domain-containing protein n=1 Tax=Nocardioides albertanoniae TaxID=1175486 RepID=A0A543A2A8_9ACTN|nr:putative zinc-binding metallopeptidase [Nocardioides albertanoniae]TQL66712.1 hypothetical protein FB381_0577 [Nocardioides albertanoniae]